jgi:importin subunit alpha-6/7
VISNIATGGNKAQIMYLVEQGVIKPLCDLLDVGDVRILMVTLEAFEAILKIVPDCSKIVQLVDEAEGIDKLENLQEHENQVS